MAVAKLCDDTDAWNFQMVADRGGGGRHDSGSGIIFHKKSIGLHHT